MSDRPTQTAARDASERLLDAPGISIDRMPMLHVIFDRMAAQCSENLRQLSAAPAFFSVENKVVKRRNLSRDALRGAPWFNLRVNQRSGRPGLNRKRLHHAGLG
jgi:hypothetical protein